MLIDRLDEHQSIWMTLQTVLENNRLPHAFLFIAARHANSLQLVNRLMACLLCHKSIKTPCGQCKPCHLLLQQTHPDIIYITNETDYAPIKIDQVRELQQTIYQTPQCGERRFIVIKPADKLNIAAANALLKILEEPPSHTTFILIAEHVHTLPPTIMSRCQQYVIPALPLEAAYPEASARALLLKQRDAINAALNDLIEGKLSPCTLAAQWSAHALGDLLWILYLLTAQVIKQQLSCSAQRGRLTSIPLFNQLDKINSLMRKVQQNITLNQTLAIETLLLGYITNGEKYDK